MLPLDTDPPFDAPARPGAQLRLAELDYMFGDGPITIVVTSVGAAFDYGGFTWVEISGDEQLPGGTRPRDVSVLLSTLQRAAGRP